MAPGVRQSKLLNEQDINLAFKRFSNIPDHYREESKERPFLEVSSRGKDRLGLYIRAFVS